MENFKNMKQLLLMKHYLDSHMQKEWWQICKSVRGIHEIFWYSEDEFDSNVLHYKGCLYEFTDLSHEEMILKAIIRGNVSFFKNKPNVPMSIVLKKNITIIEL